MKSDMSIVYPNEEMFVMHKHYYQKSGDLSLVKKCEGFMYIWIWGLERFLENITTPAFIVKMKVLVLPETF